MIKTSVLKMTVFSFDLFQPSRLEHLTHFKDFLPMFVVCLALENGKVNKKFRNFPKKAQNFKQMRMQFFVHESYDDSN